MAYITISDYIDVGTGLEWTATSWQFAKDEQFEKIIDESLVDYTNKTMWRSRLPKLPEDLEEGETEGYYSDLDEIYCRVKVHLGDNDVESAWYVLGPKSQKEQMVVMTDADDNMTWTDSYVLKWHDYAIKDPNDMLTPDVKDEATYTHYEFTISNISTNNVGIQKGAFESSDYCILTGKYYETTSTTTNAYDEITSTYITSADQSDLEFDFSSIKDEIYTAVSNGQTQITTTLSEISNIREIQYQYLLRGYNSEYNGFEYAELLTTNTVIQINIGNIEEVDGLGENSIDVTTELETEYVNFFNCLYFSTNTKGTVYKSLATDHIHPDDDEEEDVNTGEDEVEDVVVDTSGRHYEFNISYIKLYELGVSMDALTTSNPDIILSGNVTQVDNFYVKAEASSLVLDSNKLKSMLETYINENVTYLSDIKNFSCTLGDITNIKELSNQYALTLYISNSGFSKTYALNADVPVTFSFTDLSIVSGQVSESMCDIELVTDNSVEAFPGLKYFNTPVSCKFNIVGRTTTVTDNEKTEEEVVEEEITDSIEAGTVSNPNVELTDELKLQIAEIQADENLSNEEKLAKIQELIQSIKNSQGEENADIEEHSSSDHKEQEEINTETREEGEVEQEEEDDDKN